MLRFQTPSTKPLDRKDHVWVKQDGTFKCCLCGAVHPNPPPYPTPDDWRPITYFKLTDFERALTVNHKGK